MPVPFLTPQTIMKVRPNADVSCRLCARVIDLCDGNRTLREVAQTLHLTQSACAKLVQRSISRNWLEPAMAVESTTDGFNYWFVISENLVEGIGAEGEELLHKAARMTKSESGIISETDVEEYLIAIELMADDSQREVLVPILDSLRDKYVSEEPAS